MSSKRGRKRNDNLPPNRARDVQRAFRARRAAHLQALEQRVSELEDENNCLRRALNLPPSNRPPLGKGPTGKDKPKYDTGFGHDIPHISRTNSSAESPGSTRDSSLSPNMVASNMPHTRGSDMDASSWDQGSRLQDLSDLPDSSMSSTFSLPPLSAKSLSYTYSSSSLPSSGRSSMNGLYLNPAFTNSADIGLSNGYASGQNYVLRDDVQDDRHYSFSQSASFQSQDINMHPHSTSPAPNHQQQRDTSYETHRRTMPEPQFAHGQPYPHRVHNHTIRLPSPPDLQDGMAHPHSHPFGVDGRINSMS